MAVLSMVINLTLPRVGRDLAKAKGTASALEVSLLSLSIGLTWVQVQRRQVVAAIALYCWVV